MAEYSNLSATINAQIRANGVQAITGPVLNAVLTAMVNVLGDGYRLNGVAVPADNPGSPDNRVAYLAAQDGTYTNFGGLTISGEVALLLWDSAWTKATLFSIDTAVTPGSGNLVTSGAVDDALTTLAGNIAAAYMQLVPGATEDNLASYDGAGQVRDSGIAAADVVKKDGVYPDLFAGYAGNLVDTRSAGTPQGPYAFRQSGGDGVDYMVRIKGKTEAFNQLGVKRPAGSDSVNNVTGTFDADGNLTIVVGTGGATGNWFHPLATNPDGYITGHKYLHAVRTDFSPSASTVQIGNNYYEWWNNPAYVWTAEGNLGNYSVQVVSGCPAGTYHISAPIIVDLTLEGLGLTTADQFRALHPLGYYNPMRKLINNAATGIKTTGFNQLDGIWHEGRIDATTGEVVAASNYSCSNYIPVFPNTQYFEKVWLDLRYYDANKNYISGENGGDNKIFTTPANCAYLRVTGGVSPAIMPSFNPIINLSDASRNGTYEPYWERTLQLGITTRKDTDGNVPFADGMKGKGTAADWADKVGGEIVMGEVDLGSLSWQYSSTFGVFRTASAVPNMKNSAQIICSKYATNNVAADQLGDKEISSVPSFVACGIMIKDSSYGTDPAAFKTAMNGVKMVFEKDTSTPFTWAEPLNLGVEVDNLGTQERLPADTADNPQAPFECDSNYSVSTANLVRLLNL